MSCRLRFSVVEAGTVGHHEAFLFAQLRFLAAFGARITTPASRYAVVTDDHCRPLAGLAIRQLDHDISGLTEKYLDEPIEAWLTRHRGAAVPRRQLVEAGSLACLDPGLAEPLLRFASIYSYLAGHSYILLTATRPVRILLKRMGQSFIDVCAALPEKLDPAMTREWGSYYSAVNRPRVCVIESRDMFVASSEWWRSHGGTTVAFRVEVPNA